MFRAQFPQVQFRIEEAPSAELDRKLLEGEIDLAFYMSFARHPGLSYRVLRRDRMYAVFGKGHPLEQAAAREGSFAWEWLEGQTLLLQNQTQRQGQYILQELRSRRLHPAEILESSNIRAAAALAANGYGIGFLSGELLEHLNNAVPFNAFPLRDYTLPLESVAAWRAGNYLPRYALAFIERMRKKYWDARHNCFAYCIGDKNQLQRCSDDGEPSQTAGRPMLDVLLGAEVHNICVVVTRYFGGTLLGTGGLFVPIPALSRRALRTVPLWRNVLAASWILPPTILESARSSTF